MAGRSLHSPFVLTDVCLLFALDLGHELADHLVVKVFFTQGVLTVVDLMPVTPSCTVRTDTSRWPPSRAKISSFLWHQPSCPSQVAVAVGFLMIQNTRPVMLAGRAFGGGKQGVTNLTAL